METNYENPMAASVEKYFSVPQSMLPPPAIEDSNKKHNRTRPSQNVRANDAKTQENDGGSRLVCAKLLPSIVGGNNRTCLLDSILQILPPTKNKELAQLAIASSMPEEEDTYIKNISNALADNGLILERVGAKYTRKGGASFHLLKENDCRIIVNIKLKNMEGITMSHFAAWDGNVIYDKPFTSKVDKSSDRTNPLVSSLTFG